MNIEEIENNTLTVKAFDNQLKGHKNQIHPSLPQPPCSLCLVGSIGNGKSNLIVRLIFGNKKKKGAKDDFHKFYRHFFDRIYVFSPTWARDDKTGRCGIPDDQIYEDAEYYPEILQEIIATQAEEIEEDGKENCEHVLLIFSDLAGAKGVFGSNKGIMNKLAFNLRHYNISLIIDTQSLRQINSAFRDNFSGICIFGGITNRLEIGKIYEEYLGDFTKDEANALLEYVFHDSRFNFLFINFQKDKNSRYFKNFNQLVINRKNNKLLQ